MPSVHCYGGRTFQNRDIGVRLILQSVSCNPYENIKFYNLGIRFKCINDHGIIFQLPASLISLLAQLVRALHRYRRGHGFESCTSLNLCT